MLYEKLKEYTSGDVYPMHMPGHKRNAELMPPGLPCEIDITEIHGFDDLHDPCGFLLETAELAASLYSSAKAFPLINGSTAGILAAIGAHTKRGDKILAPSNSHRSVRNTTELFGLQPVYITPETDEATGVPCSIDPAVVKHALDNDPEIKLVVITSPTYEGIVSDVRTIAGIAHERGLPLLVDSAHGAHLGFSQMFPENATRLGADVVVMSLHKTLPALTQCSLLHICGKNADAGETARLLSVLQTSSPSYVLMASIDHCLRLLSSDKYRLFHEYGQNLTRFYTDVSILRNLSVLGSAPGASRPGVGLTDTGYHGASNHGTNHTGFFAYDPGKIVITTKSTSLSGAALSDILRNEHKIELELSSADYAIAMTSVCDRPEGFTRLATALLAIDCY